MNDAGGKGAPLLIRWQGPIGEAAAPLLDLCHRVFDDFADAYLLDRLLMLDGPSLWLAIADGEWVGFKLGYRRGTALFYSWLGGVDPRFRRRGVAAALMERQHEEAAASGCTHAETRTRASNNAMIMTNLRHHFHIAGFEIDAAGHPVVIQRKPLGNAPRS